MQDASRNVFKVQHSWILLPLQYGPDYYSLRGKYWGDQVSHCAWNWETSPDARLFIAKLGIPWNPEEIGHFKGSQQRHILENKDRMVRLLAMENKEGQWVVRQSLNVGR